MNNKVPADFQCLGLEVSLWAHWSNTIYKLNGLHSKWKLPARSYKQNTYSETSISSLIRGGNKEGGEGKNIRVQLPMEMFLTACVESRVDIPLEMQGKWRESKGPWNQRQEVEKKVNKGKRGRWGQSWRVKEAREGNKNFKICHLFFLHRLTGRDTKLSKLEFFFLGSLNYPDICFGVVILHLMTQHLDDKMH